MTYQADCSNIVAGANFSTCGWVTAEDPGFVPPFAFLQDMLTMVPFFTAYVGSCYDEGDGSALLTEVQNLFANETSFLAELSTSIEVRHNKQNKKGPLLLLRVLFSDTQTLFQEQKIDPEEELEYCKRRIQSQSLLSYREDEILETICECQIDIHGQVVASCRDTCEICLEEADECFQRSYLLYNGLRWYNDPRGLMCFESGSDKICLDTLRNPQCRDPINCDAEVTLNGKVCASSINCGEIVLRDHPFPRFAADCTNLLDGAILDFCANNYNRTILVGPFKVLQAYELVLNGKPGLDLLGARRGYCTGEYRQKNLDQPQSSENEASKDDSIVILRNDKGKYSGIFPIKSFFSANPFLFFFCSSLHQRIFDRLFFYQRWDQDTIL
jgi:hypothetical protein